MGQPSYMRSVIDRNVVMQRIPVLVDLLRVFLQFKTVIHCYGV
jgi:hypothetical protein